ncbi:glutathione S-transferase U10-like [Cucurbita maxima]|uniref:Glutathione S-transferase n=1 Tax=Cucurbita maxima TaxID=3661 RepID=A0A6J1HSP4_CUCMA|nr:glutathione S-transferase U10-like [Cucurbita maxima]
MEAGKQSDVVLFGTWYSSYCTRIILALKMKGINFEYVEEDLANKSELLINFNPVHQKVPVLVHKGNPIAESFVILEYIEDHWNHRPKILPEDPYERSKVRFWAQFYDQKIILGTLPIFKSEREEREGACKELSKLIRVFEEGMKKDFPGKFPFYDGKNLGLLDIVVGPNACNYLALREVLGDVIGSKRNPDFFSWVDALKDHPLIKETLPPHHKMVQKLKEKMPQKPKDH